MTENNNKKINSAFIAVKKENLNNIPHADYCLQLKGKKVLFSSVEDGCWVIVVDAANVLLGVGRVYRQRSDLESTTLFFDKYLKSDSNALVSLPRSGQISRVEWTLFA